MGWTIGSKHPFGITSKPEFDWIEVGVLFRLICEHNVGLFIETGMNNGDLAVWMLLRTLTDEHFHYLGITNDPSLLDKSIEQLSITAPKFIVLPGVCYSKSVLQYVSKLVGHTYKSALVFCDGCDIQREYKEYLDILRPGDVIIANKFPSVFPLASVQKMVGDGAIKRLVTEARGSDFMIGIKQ